MRILFINNDGGGFAGHTEVEEGTTAWGLFEQKLPGREPQDFLIRINREPAAAGQVLQEGDGVSIAPTKVEGASD